MWHNSGRPEEKLVVSLWQSLHWSCTGILIISFFLPLNNCMKMRCLELLQPSCDPKDERLSAKAKYSGQEAKRWKDPGSLMTLSTEHNYAEAALSLSFLLCGIHVSDVVKCFNDLLLVFCNITSPGAAFSPSIQAPEFLRPLLQLHFSLILLLISHIYCLIHNCLSQRNFLINFIHATLHLRISSQGA